MSSPPIGQAVADMIAEMSTDFWSCRADLGIKDRGFIEQWIKSLVVTDMEWYICTM